MRYTLLTLAAAFSISTAGAPVLAKSGSWQIGNSSFKVYGSDLDTGTPAGRKALLKRVEHAAAKLCRQPLAIEQDECVEEVIAMAKTAPRAGALRLALQERDGTRLAAR